ncbi:Ger(x)C family spore germination protein [Paenibacillus radicis (ex Gao et al. 2016)]|uniref:Germination protein GerC n=1 Tax=Paenibacillus radicis (ex Gao et al. 2016) TaxID=1737354 RepID=A0A917LQF3_9BACL|nr:Ger(x)C family spore germination protein [Paenibacillus radicis (ex Gao et al. 2016)]GGG51345.1 germination protein GerC [Paenibacillus radicis (ex Gao et al. 2016)]
MAATTLWRKSSVKAPLLLKLVLPLTILFTATGCWDEVDLQKVSYAAALGIDYVDDNYVVYTQLLSFDSIAKRETSAASEKPIWIGAKKGDTPLGALFNLMNTSQYNLSMDHLKTIVIHERAFAHVKTILDGINRMRATRYTTYIYGTQEDLEKLFTIDNFFSSSPLNSILYSPQITHRENSFVLPMRMQDVVRQGLEPGMTTLLPSIRTSNTEWKNDGKQMDLDVIDGVFAFKNSRFAGFLPRKEISGLAWGTEGFERTIVSVTPKENQEATVIIDNSKMNVTWDPQTSIFHLQTNMQGHIVEWDTDVDRVQFVKMVEEKVKKEIRATIVKGQEIGVDVYPLEHVLYRYHLKQWKEIRKKGVWKPSIDEIRIDVNFTLKYSGEVEVFK